MNKVHNANMYHKSVIQQQIEYNNILEKFKSALSNLVESYTVNGNVFWCPNGTPSEVDNGYMVVEHTTDNLQDAIREMTSLNMCIRINENKSFQIGHVYSTFSGCPLNSEIIDIENQTTLHS